METRNSERVKAQFLSNPKVEIGSSSTQPILKVKDKKVKNWKNKYISQGTKLYHGQQRRRSERIQSQFLSKPIVGIGSCSSQPIVIK
jgi:hypothetical protein